VRRIIVILDAVVAATLQFLCDQCPLVAQLLAEGKDQAFFIEDDGSLVDRGVQMVVPPFTTLFTRAPGAADHGLEALSDESPLLSAELAHELHDGLIFLSTPELARCSLARQILCLSTRRVFVGLGVLVIVLKGELFVVLSLFFRR